MPYSYENVQAPENDSGQLWYFEVLLNQAIFGDHQQTRDESWNTVFNFIEMKKEDQQGEKWLGLEEFLNKLHNSLFGKELDDIVLVFNAGEIKLIEWFNELTPNLNEPTPETNSDSSAQVGRTYLMASMVYDMDELRVADIFL